VSLSLGDERIQPKGPRSAPTLCLLYAQFMRSMADARVDPASIWDHSIATEGMAIRSLAWRNRAVRYSGRPDATLPSRVEFSWPIHVGRRRYRREPV
jgi:hypothetical protein